MLILKKHFFHSYALLEDDARRTRKLSLKACFKVVSWFYLLLLLFAVSSMMMLIFNQQLEQTRWEARELHENRWRRARMKFMKYSL